MGKDIKAVRWITFVALLAMAIAILFPFVTWTSSRIGLSVILVILAAALLTWALEKWLFFLLSKFENPPVLISDRTTELEKEIAVVMAAMNKISSSQSEREILTVLLNAGNQILGSVGSSFLSLNEWRQPTPPIMVGDVPESAQGEWIDRLAEPGTRQVCRLCKTRDAGDACPLCAELRSTPVKIYCQPITINSLDLGLVNFFFDTPCLIDKKKKEIVKLLADTTATSLSIREISIRERQMLSRLNTSRIGDDLLENLLMTAKEVRDQFSFTDVIFLFKLFGGLESVSSGDVSESEENQNESFTQSIWYGFKDVQRPYFGSAKLNKMSDVADPVLAMPIRVGERNLLGVMICGYDRPGSEVETLIPVLELISGTIAIAINSVTQLEQNSYEVAVEERYHLAREIHDGIAQTLAFLKIQSSRMLNELNLGKLDTLERSLATNYQTVSSAFQDARDEINSLRFAPESGTKVWLEKIGKDFEKDTGIKVDSSKLGEEMDLSLPVQAQLIRIIQEALTNVRKHSGAKKVVLSSRTDNDEVVFEVSDDGCGFEPDQVSVESKYGLVGMRERTDMVGGEFQVVSLPSRGTTVKVSLPIREPGR